MQNKKHLLQKHIIRKGARRGISFLLSLCMSVSLFAGVVTFPVFAQESDQGTVTEPAEQTSQSQAEPSQEPQQPGLQETNAEIKARLMREIRAGTRDPYSSSMSMDEFYALMELFQEGSLPLEEDPIAEELPGTDWGKDEPSMDEPSMDEPSTDEPSMDEPSTDEPLTDEPSTDEPSTDEPSTDEPSTDEPSTDEPSIDAPSTDEPSMDEPSTDGPSTDEPSTDAPSIDAPSIDAPSTDEPSIDAPSINAPSTDKPSINAPSADEPLTGGTTPDAGDGTDSGSTAASTKITHIPSEMFVFSVPSGYKQPSVDWPGVQLSNGMSATIAVRGINDKNVSVSGDVVQGLFPAIDGLYVRRVTALNNEVSVLGAIWQPGAKTWVYYYTTAETQSTDVSATTLPDGKQFIIHYVPIEHSVSFQIRFRPDDLTPAIILKETGYSSSLMTLPSGGSYYPTYTGDATTKYPDLADWVRQLPRLNDNTDEFAKLSEIIFGEEFPSKTDEGKYAFTATAPDGYTLAFYLSDKQEDGVWHEGKAQLVTYEGYGGKPGRYTSVNQGWALGMEPVYAYNTTDHKLMSLEEKGPQELVTTGTFANNNVTEDRIVVAVLKKKPTPTFDAYNLINGTSKTGAPQVNDYVNGRGTSAPYTVKATNRETGREETILYDYVDAFLWFKYGEDGEGENRSKYEYTIEGLGTTASLSNLQAGNVATIDSWGWNDANKKKNEAVFHTMDPETDKNGSPTGAYSYRWTWQCNDSNGGYTMDTLEINRTGITIPFLAKLSLVDSEKYEGPARDPGDPDDMGGVGTWFAKTILPDGAVVLVEYLMHFNSKQRVYRISVTGAKNNITVTHMNLMMGTGAPEIAVYQLDGVTGATNQESDTRKAAIQYFGTVNKDWGDNRNRGEVIVDNNDYPGGVYYNGGDTSVGRANIRFKLGSGYSSPVYLLESKEGNVVEGQASIQRNRDDLTLDRTTQNPVVPWVSDGNDPYMKHDANNVPYPVDSSGDKLYYYNDENEFVQFTDWSILRVEVDATGKEVLVPTLYNSARTELAKAQVIVESGKTFKWWNENTDRLNPQYIYAGEDGWHYISLTGHDSAKFALLTIVAYPTRYVVRYKPGVIPAYVAKDETVEEAHAPANMPEIDHYGTCPTFLQGDPEENPNDDRVKNQFDDNEGNFYDIEVYTEIAINATKPVDPKGYYRFLDWVLVDENDNPVLQYVEDPENPGNWKKKADGSFVTQEVRFTSGSFFVKDYAEYAILNGDLGTTDNDIYVLRLMPTWELMENPYHYKVALNWVDALGVLHEEYFDDKFELWQEVLTDFNQGDNDGEEGPVVKILTDATPFQNWIALHPTYSFWDPVNNAVNGEKYDPNAEWRQADPLTRAAAGYSTYHPDYINHDKDEWSAEEKVRHALDEYFPKLADDASSEEIEKWQEKYDAALAAIMTFDRPENNKTGNGTDDFNRQDNYTFVVLEDRGTIILWMYEDKGGLTFHKAVDAEPFITGEEFYFTVNQVKVGNSEMLNGIYKAYPETVYDAGGAVRTVEDSDAWLVEFSNGNIVNIVKNDGSDWPSTAVTYFTVKNGEGIQLYVPGGTYTIAELGSKSGGTYRTEVTFVAAEDIEGTSIKKGMEQVPRTGWQLPTEYKWLTGSSKNVNKDQVSATVNFAVGAHDVARVINFSNQTSAVSIENLVVGPYQGEQLGYTVTLILPEGAEPLLSEDGLYYYFNFNLYDVTYPEGAGAKYKDEYVKEPNLSGVAYAPPAKKGSDEYNNWLTAKTNGYAAWLGSEEYAAWWAWHTWRPEGTTEVNTSGRLVVKKDSTNGDGSVNWEATKLLTQSSNSLGAASEWIELTNSVNGVIGLKSGQRFYVVCTVPEQGSNINYTIEETDTSGYTVPAGNRPRVRTGKAVAAELAYELFQNSKLQGLPATGGMGDGAFRLAGLVFLASGLGLVCVNRKERRRAEAKPSDPAERR